MRAYRLRPALVYSVYVYVFSQIARLHFCQCPTNQHTARNTALLLVVGSLFLADLLTHSPDGET